MTRTTSGAADETANDVGDGAAAGRLGWAPDEVALDEPTRRSRLRWVVVVDTSLPAGMAVNAAVCLAAATGEAVTGLLGPGGVDADGTWHPGLPWAGCTVLGASPQELLELRARATQAQDVLVSDMPGSAQTNRVYADYLRELGETGGAELALRAVSVLGPRNRVDRLVTGLALLA